MPALKGLTSLYDELDKAPAGSIDEGALEARAFTPDPAHGKIGDTSLQVDNYHVQGTYYDAAPNDMLGEYDIPGQPYAAPQGDIDNTPTTHRALWPRPQVQQISTLDPDYLAVVGEQARILHGTDMGGPRNVGRAIAGSAEPVDWTSDLYAAPNDTAQGSNVPGQIRGANADTMGDTVQGYGHTNSLEPFNRGHSMRFVQHDRLQFDHSLSNGESGTWLGKHPSGTESSLDGEDSPYGAQGSLDGLQRAGMATVMGYPTPYTQPANPTVNAPVSTVDVWSYG